MKILGLETSSAACSIALMNDNIIIEKNGILPLQHGSVALDWISEILSEADMQIGDLDAVAYSCGPGSFTGIRISAALGQGIALSHNIPLIAVPSLQTIAEGIYRDHDNCKVMVLIDARMGQVYCGYYVLGVDGLMEAYKNDSLCTFDDIDFEFMFQNEWVLVTDLVTDVAFVNEKLHLFKNIHTSYYPKAYDVLQIAAKKIVNHEIKPLEEALPVYLRSEDYWKKIDAK